VADDGDPVAEKRSGLRIATRSEGADRMLAPRRRTGVRTCAGPVDADSGLSRSPGEPVRAADIRGVRSYGRLPGHRFDHRYRRHGHSHGYESSRCPKANSSAGPGMGSSPSPLQPRSVRLVTGRLDILSGLNCCCPAGSHAQRSPGMWSRFQGRGTVLTHPRVRPRIVVAAPGCMPVGGVGEPTTKARPLGTGRALVLGCVVVAQPSGAGTYGARSAASSSCTRALRSVPSAVCSSEITSPSAWARATSLPWV
jgi:hypothetical protein